MVSFNQKNLGYMLVTFSIILLVILALVKADVDKEEAFLCKTVHSIPTMDIENCPAHKSNISWLLLTAFGIAFLILGSGIYIIFMPSKKEKQEFKETDLSKLDQEEKKIYNILKQHEGSIYQSDLIKETDFSKVKITRLLDKMESKKLIERKRRGMTNVIVLK